MDKQIDDVVQTFKNELEIWYNTKKHGKMCFTVSAQNGRLVHCEIKGTKTIILNKKEE